MNVLEKGGRREEGEMFFLRGSMTKWKFELFSSEVHCKLLFLCFSDR